MAAVLCQSIASLCQALVFVATCPCRACGGDSCQWLGQALASPFTPYLLTTVALHLPPFGWGIRALVGILSEGIRCKPGDRWLWVNGIMSMIHIWGAFYIVKRIQEERSMNGSSMNNVRGNINGGGIQPMSPSTEIMEFNDDGSEGIWKNVEDTNERSLTPVPRTNFQNLQNNQLQKPIKRPTLGDKILYTIGKQTAFPAVPSSKSWKERASRDVILGVTESDDDGEANSLQRLKQVFCYDIIVAFYMTTIVFWCIWQSVGISHVLFRKRPARHQMSHNRYGANYNYNANNDYNNAANDYDNANYDYNNANFDYNNANYDYNNANYDYNNANANANYNYNNNANDNVRSYFDSYDSYDEDELCDNIEYWIILSILCSFLYIMLVCVAFSCSLLCMRY